MATSKGTPGRPTPSLILDSEPITQVIVALSKQPPQEHCEGQTELGRLVERNVTVDAAAATSGAALVGDNVPKIEIKQKAAYHVAITVDKRVVWEGFLCDGKGDTDPTGGWKPAVNSEDALEDWVKLKATGKLERLNSYFTTKKAEADYKELKAYRVLFPGGPPITNDTENQKQMQTAQGLIANALKGLTDNFEETDTTVNQHTGQIRDLQGEQKALKDNNRELHGKLAQQGKELDQVKQLVAMSVTGQRQQQREGGEEAEEDGGVESETFHEALEEEEETEESPVAAKEAEVDASSEEESARSSDDDNDIGEDEVEDDGALSGAERVLIGALGDISEHGRRIGHLQNGMNGLRGNVNGLRGNVNGLQVTVADTQNRERMNKVEIETIKVRLSSAGL